MNGSPATVGDLLAGTSARLADRTALVEGDARRTWAELAEAVAERSGALAGAGVGPGRAIAVVLPNGIDFVVDVLAVMGLGAVVVPLNPQLTPRELDTYARVSHVSGIVATPELAEPLRERADAEVWGHGVWVVTPEDRPPAATTTIDRAHGPAPDDPAIVAFSSGSTGTPKRIVRTHANLIHEADGFFATVGTSEADVILTVVPLSHAHGWGNCLLASLRSGAAMVVLPRFDRDAVLGAVERHRVTIFPGVPAMFGALADTRRATPERLASLRLCFSAGAALAPEISQRFLERFGLPVRQLYGCSEVGALTINLDGEPTATAASVGRPLKGVELVVRRESGERCDPGEPGEISFTSPALAAGYVDDPASESFVDGWFHSGDLGYLDTAGHLHLTGRTTLFIARGGYKVDPSEVEAVLQAHPDVAEVVVVGSRGGMGEEIVKAVVVAQGGRDDRQLRQELIARCRAELAEFKVPRVVEFRPEIPRSPLGKILRKYLV